MPAIRSAGVQVYSLPPYSPDMNPIEMVFCKLKTLLRQDPAAPSTPSGAVSMTRSMLSRPMTVRTTAATQAKHTHPKNALNNS